MPETLTDDVLAGQGFAEVVERRPLQGATDAHSGATFERLTLADGGRLVLKMIPSGDWIMRATADVDRLGELWEAGVFGCLPPVIDHAMLATTPLAAGRLVVMRDVSEVLVPAGARISRGASRRVLEAAAALHDRFRGGVPGGLCRLADYYRIFAPATSQREGADETSPAHWFPRGWERFAEIVPVDVATAVLRILDDASGLAAQLERLECTLVHGDLELQNVGLASDRVVLIDWGSLNSLGPPEVDFAWYLAHNASRIDASPADLVADFREAEGDRHDPRALDLALLGELAHWGWKWALVATTSRRPEAAAAAGAELDWWVHRVRRALEMWSPV